VYFTNNVAAGGEGMGIWVLFPEEPLPPSRQYNMMDVHEARRTGLLDFYNNVGHSNVGVRGDILYFYSQSYFKDAF